MTTIKTWAIQFTDSVYRKWDHFEDHSILTVSWDKNLKINNVNEIDHIQLTAKEFFPEYNIADILNLTDRVKYIANSMTLFDNIITYNNDLIIQKYGGVNVIDKSHISLNKIYLKIFWYFDFSDQNKKLLLEREYDIQEYISQNEIISDKVLNYEHIFTNKFEIENESNDENFVKFSQISILNESPIYEPKADPGGIVKLFYGTNRNLIGKEVNKYYGVESEKLHFGVCSVSIPPGHTKGILERPKKLLWLIDLPENKKKHIALAHIEELSEVEFKKKFSSGLSDAKSKEGLIFIHGYNNTFAAAARRTAQLVYDIDFQGVPSFFSWPSFGTALKYPRDVEKARNSSIFLQQFIETLLSFTQLEKLHIIAHSMGNLVLGKTISDLSNKTEIAEDIKKIHQIILGAPDINQEEFTNNILPHFLKVGSRRTLYASDQDIALWVSEKFRSGLVRLGEGGKNLFITKEIDTVDASNVPESSNGHGYMFETYEVLQDLLGLVTNDLPPEKRGLKKRGAKNIDYWLFPKAK
ncbi:MAG TPA: alpha/beta hydrolase [Saprospiraceae bacterium]|nr:alpha/beta hydrolase [Saprospiraceae bacterium]